MKPNRNAAKWTERSEEVRKALAERGYTLGWFESTPDRHIRCFLDGKHTLILVEQDGGWDLFAPLTESLEIAKVIAKIPVSAVSATSQV